MSQFCAGLGIFGSDGKDAFELVDRLVEPAQVAEIEGDQPAIIDQVRIKFESVGGNTRFDCSKVAVRPREAGEMGVGLDVRRIQFQRPFEFAVGVGILVLRTRESSPSDCALSPAIHRAASDARYCWAAWS